MALYDLPEDHFERFVPMVAKVAEEDVSAAASAHLVPDRAVVAVVGDSDRVIEGLRSLGLGDPVLVSADAD
jgi:hypothetical protein